MECRTESIVEWLLGRSAPPQRITFYLSYHCNLSCPFCVTESPRYTRQHPGIDEEMTGEQLSQLVHDAAVLGVAWWEVVGGEPFYDPEKASRFLAAIKRHGMSGSVITNGVLLTRSIIKRLVEVGWDEITISLDSAFPSVHDRYRGKNTHRFIVASIREFAAQRNRLKKNKPDIRVNALLTRDNIGEVREMVQLGISLALRGLYFLQPVAANSFAQSLVIPWMSAPSMQAKITAAHALAQEGGLETNLAAFLPGKVRPEQTLRETLLQRSREAMLETSAPIACYDPFHRLTATINGWTSPCRSIGALLPSTATNLKHRRLAEIWYGEEFSAFRQAARQGHLPAVCDTCCENVIEDNHALRIATNPLVIHDRGVLLAIAGEWFRARAEFEIYNRLALFMPGQPVLALDTFPPRDLVEPGRLMSSQLLESLRSLVPSQTRDGCQVNPLELGSLLLEKNDWALALSVFTRGVIWQPGSLPVWLALVAAALAKYPRLAGKILLMLLANERPEAGFENGVADVLPVLTVEALADFVLSVAAARKINLEHHVEFLNQIACGLRDRSYPGAAIGIYRALLSLAPQHQSAQLALCELTTIHGLYTGIFFAMTFSDEKCRVFLRRAQHIAPAREKATAALQVIEPDEQRWQDLPQRIARVFNRLRDVAEDALAVMSEASQEQTMDTNIRQLLEQQAVFVKALVREPALSHFVDLALLELRLGKLLEAATLLVALLPIDKKAPYADEYNRQMMDVAHGMLETDRWLELLDEGLAQRDQNLWRKWDEHIFLFHLEYELKRREQFSLAAVVIDRYRSLLETR